MKRKNRILIYIAVIALVLAFAGLLPRIVLGLPLKPAVFKEDIEKYSNCILIQQTWHTGTGWEMVGDQFGFMCEIDWYDVHLTGNLPPLSSFGDNANKYLCNVEYLGGEYLPDLFEEYEVYEVLDWYPIYPVKRDTVLPPWLYPKGYMTEWDLG